MISVKPIILGLQVESNKNKSENNEEDTSTQVVQSKLFSALNALDDNIRDLDRRIKILEG